ncbi:response regulator transcription factor [Subtercola sp. RTI3]|uniref:response regulator transcription factor n=1 Tax=Subtercola sp. RTI3 TaxID=3048639 RepID=UPI002B23B60B|nr:response regulator transcription factor [Subtercola sp. RTI3]MEA9987225.1 response regulator transcription factor [Subtercola sp. RTI3]
MGKPTVVIADEIEIYRKGLASTLREDARLSVVGESGSARQAVTLVRDLEPRILILSTTADGFEALNTVRLIKAASSNTRVVLFGIHVDANTITELSVGTADGFLGRTTQAKSLVGALVQIAYAPTGSLTILTTRRLPLPGREDIPKVSVLSARELDVLRHVAASKTNAQVGAALYISEGTVKRHLSNAYRKLDGARSRLDAVQRATSAGLLT